MNTLAHEKSGTAKAADAFSKTAFSSRDNAVANDLMHQG
jgi:hypothetical protein